MEGKPSMAFLALILKTVVSNVILADPPLRHVSRIEIDEEMSLFKRSEIEKNTVQTERTEF